jgi:hypothetical protein
VNTLALLAAALGLVAALGSVVVVTLTDRRRTLRPSRSVDSRAAVAVLDDQRSCFQMAMDAIAKAIHRETDEHVRRAAGQLVNLLTASPSLIFSEVIDDETLARIERGTDASVIWIVTSNEAIEFEYPDPVTSFSPIVLDNVKRDITYRYLVVDTATARERSSRIKSLASEGGQAERLQIRFLPERYWRALERNTDELIVFDRGPGGSQMYYVFPGTATPGLVRRWIEAPLRDAEARVVDLRATWELADSFSVANQETSARA